MDTYQTITTAGAPETQNEGKRLGKTIADLIPEAKTASVVCLYGELGAGKTTFVQGFAAGLGLTHRIISPTFLIMKTYPLPVSGVQFIHADLYRIQTEDELSDIGLDHMMNDPHNVICIEWAEKLEKLLPQSRIDIRFMSLDSGSHSIEITYVQ